MKVALLSTLSVVAAFPTSQFPTWDEYKVQFNVALNSAEDEAKYAKQYEEGVQRIARKNEERDFVSGVNQFTMYTLDEFRNKFLGALPLEDSDMPRFRVIQDSDTDVPESQDWTTYSDVVNPIKNQDACGSCWAFASTSALESGYALSSGSLYSLSEQQLVDCDTEESGCDGGAIQRVASDFYPANGACDESSYPYSGSASSCEASSCNVVIPAGTVQGVGQIAGADDMSLRMALVERPVMLTVYASGSWTDYESGILAPTHCYDDINHAVVAVGYDSTASYWKIRNSWGTGWGEDGYARLTSASDCPYGTSAMWVQVPCFPTLTSTVAV